MLRTGAPAIKFRDLIQNNKAYLKYGSKNLNNNNCRESHARDQDVLNQGATIRPQQQIKQDLYYRTLYEKGGTVAELSKAVLYREEISKGQKFCIAIMKKWIFDC